MNIGGVSADIIATSVGMAQGSVMSAVSTEVLNKAMDNMEIAGAGLMKLMDAAEMERSVNPHIGSNFDVSV